MARVALVAGPALLFCAALRVAGANAATAPLLHPQWINVPSHDVRASDRIVSMTGPTWAALANGEFAVLTQGQTLILRRYAADGRVLATRRLKPPGSITTVDTAVMKPVPSGGANLMLGSRFACAFVRLDPDLLPRWSIELPGAFPYDNPCRGFDVLPDGSSITLRQWSLSRIAADGQEAWTVNHGDDGRWFEAEAMRLDAQGTPWIAARGGLVGGSGNAASIMHYDGDGALLAADDFLCEDCIANYATTVDVMPDGGILVGIGASAGHDSFLVRYAASGAREWVISAPSTGYSRIEHDANSLYASLPDPLDQIRRIDPRNGTVLWSVEGDDFIPVATGVVVLRRSGDATSVTALGDSGDVRWSHVLSDDPAYRITRPLNVDGEVQALSDTISTSPTRCGSPRLLGWDATGRLERSFGSCSMPGASQPNIIDARPGTGMLANLGYALVSFTPEGDERWTRRSCGACDDSGESRWLHASLTTDGGAWAVARPGRSPPHPDDPTFLLQIDEQGEERSSTVIDDVAGYPEIRLLATPQDVISVNSARQRLIWRRVRADGIGQGTRMYVVPDDDYTIVDARRLADDSVVVALAGLVVCTVGCTPRHVVVLSIASDGREQWRREFGGWENVAALDASGGARIIRGAEGPEGLLAMRDIAPDGTLGTEVPLGEVARFARPTQLSPPASGRWLLNADGASENTSALWLLDAQGHVEAMQWTYGWILSTDSPGHVVIRSNEIALLDPVSLATRATFDFGGWGTGDDFLPWPWRVLDDGTVYGTLLTHREGFEQVGVARYELPSSPSNIVFRYGFE